MPATYRGCSMLVAMALVAMLLGGAEGVHAADIEVTTPRPQTAVTGRPRVEGRVSDAKAQVFVIVNPVDTPDQFWVQPPAIVQPDGTWRAIVYIGRPGSVDVGKRFELRAVANPKDTLKEAQVLSRWPDADASSSVIEVQRK